MAAQDTLDQSSIEERSQTLLPGFLEFYYLNAWLFGSPAVSTDKADYSPGETALITASGFEAGEPITFEIDHVSNPGEDGIYGTSDDTVAELGGAGHDPWTVVDGGGDDLDGAANGIVVTSWFVDPDDSLGARFLLSATGGTGTAYSSFTDFFPGYVAPVGASGDGDATVDLTALDSPTVEDNGGAIWTNDVYGAGTGVISPFKRLQLTGNGTTEDGVNTSGDLNNDEKAQANGYTRDLLLSEVGFFTSTVNDPVNGVGVLDPFAAPGEYFGEFRLDVNENSNSSGQQYISLDELMIFISTEDNLTIDATDVHGKTAAQVAAEFYDSDTSGAPANLELVHDLDADDDNNWVALNYDLQAGSGVGDIAMYIPLQDFFDKLDDIGLAGGVADFPNTYVYLVSAFGSQGVGTGPLLSGDETYDTDGGTQPAVYEASDGFEEWSVIKNAVLPGAIEGYKYEDDDGDGTLDPGETGVGDWHIYLYDDANGDGIFDADDAAGGPDFTTQTLNEFSAPDPGLVGFYRFAGLAPGTYWIVEENVPGWTNTNAATVEVSGTDHVLLGPVTVVAGQTVGDDEGGTDFLNFADFCISGIKYEDGAGEGDPDDFLAWTHGAVTVFIDDDGDGVLDAGERSTVTDAAGAYGFCDLALSDVGKTVREVVPAGSESTGAVSHTIQNPGSGQTGSGYDFANFRLATICGYKFFDDDRNGGWDRDDSDGIVEPPGAGWTIELFADRNDNGAFDPGIDDVDPAIALTDASGKFTFTELSAGTYFLREVQQPGFFQTTPQFGGNGVLTVEVDQSGETVEADVAGDELLFGNARIDGSGVRTPGFWGQPLGCSFWDGDPGNNGAVGGSGPKDADEFPDHDLLQDTEAGSPGGIRDGVPDGLLIGDFLGAAGSAPYDGITGPGENTLHVPFEDAKLWVNGDGFGDGNKGPDNKTEAIQRDALATWLNILAGNEYAVSPGGLDPDTDVSYWLDQAVIWLTLAGDAKIKAGGKGNPNTPSWQDSFVYNGPADRFDIDHDGDFDSGFTVESGLAIHSALDGYNNLGLSGLATAEPFVLAFDGDTWATPEGQSWLAAHALDDTLV